MVIDEFYNTPLLLQRFMFSVLGLTVIILHPLVIYVLLFQSKNMNKEMRVGYLVLQLSQLLQDVFFCILFQPYPLTPQPLFGCMGLLCDLNWLAPVHIFGCIGIFLNSSFVIYLVLLLRTQQSLIFGESRLKLTPRSHSLAVLALSFCAVSVAVVFFFSADEHPKRTEIIRELNVSWILRYTKYAIVLGADIGDAGDLRPALLILAVFNVFMYSTMISLIYLIIRELKSYAKFESSQKRLYRTARTLLSELLVCGLLYVFPCVTIIFLSLSPPRMIPDLIYFAARIAFVVCFAIQSTATSLMFLKDSQFVKKHRKRMCKIVHRRKKVNNTAVL